MNVVIDFLLINVANELVFPLFQLLHCVIVNSLGNVANNHGIYVWKWNVALIDDIAEISLEVEWPDLLVGPEQLQKVRGD